MAWRSRGYFPHLDGAGLIQHVVIHLADSLPRDVVERLDRESRSTTTGRQDEVRRERIDTLLDSGCGRCILREPELASQMQAALLFFHGERYRLIAWVVMPNHVHALLRTTEGWALGKIVGSWKSYGSRRIGEWLRARQRVAESDRPGKGSKRDDSETDAVWHREYFDRFMRDEEQLAAAIRYIHDNPVKAGLVENAEQWLWSSAFPENAKRLGDKN